MRIEPVHTGSGNSQAETGADGLATLFIVDQSLTKMGGHHFDYARLVAKSAAQMGIVPVIGANRSLKSDAERELSRFAQVEKAYRETTYTRLSHLAGLRELVAKSTRIDERRPDPDKGRIHNFLGYRARKKRVKERSRLIRQFAEDCDSFFQRYSFDEQDHVLFTTISELEFMGIAAFLGNNPRSIQVNWHVQFHFSMFSGRPDEFACQSTEERLLTSAFQSALSRIPYHNLKAYTTSQELAHQYNRMKLISFEELPYPVNPELFNRADDPVHSIHIKATNSDDPGNKLDPAGPKRRLKIAVAGGVRREKGQKTNVSHLINSIWDSHLANGDIQLNIQAGSPGAFSCNRVMDSRVSHKQFRDIVQVHPHPLPEDDYVRFIQDADAGLFCYDSRRYFSRRAGILSEFLACGKPVIVPAGSWLSQQIAEPAFNHVERLVRNAANKMTVDITDLKWTNDNVPLTGRAISFDQARNPFCCRFEKNELLVENPTAIAIGFRWQWPAETGSFVRTELACFDKNGKSLDGDCQTVSCLPNNPVSLLMLRLPKGFARGQLEFRNAFGNSAISIGEVEVNFLEFGEQPQPPSSAVGVIASDQSMMARAVDELVSHYDHYLASAIHFSRFWSNEHHPIRTIESLIPINKLDRKAA